MKKSIRTLKAVISILSVILIILCTIGLIQLAFSKFGSVPIILEYLFIVIAISVLSALIISLFVYMILNIIENKKRKETK